MQPINALSNKSLLTTKNWVRSSKGLPSELIYRRHVDIPKHPRDEFTMFSTKDGQIKSFMVCHKLNMPLREDYKGDSLGIDFLFSYEGSKGYGSKFLDFAKIFSKQIGCNGYIALKADSSLSINKAPHQFYRKNGFTTLDSKFDSKIDKYNRKHLQGSYKDFSSKLMFYPQPEAKPTFFDKVLTYFNLKP